MKAFVILFISVFLVATNSGTARAALSLDLIPRDPANPNKCVRESDGINLPIGESKFGPGCIRTTCAAAGNDNLSLEKATCALDVSEQCMKFEDETKRYPECCKKVPC